MLAFAYNISFNLISSRSGYHGAAAAKLVCQRNKSEEPRGWTSQGVKREPEMGEEGRKKRSGRDRIKGKMQKPHTQVNEELPLHHGTRALEEQGGAICSHFIIY